MLKVPSWTVMNASAINDTGQIAGSGSRHYHKPINFIFIDTRHKQAYYSIINTVYRYAPILRLDVGRMIDNKHMTDLEAVSNYRG